MSATSLPPIPEPENMVQAKNCLKINDNLWILAKHLCSSFICHSQDADASETLMSSPLSFSSTVLGDGRSQEGMLGQGTVIGGVVFEWVFFMTFC